MLLWELGKNELCFTNLSVTSPTSQPLQRCYCENSVRMSSVSPTFPSLLLRHNSFSNPSFALPTSQLILQPFFRFSYVTGSSLNSPGEPPMLASLFSCHGDILKNYDWLILVICLQYMSGYSKALKMEHYVSEDLTDTVQQDVVVEKLNVCTEKSFPNRCHLEFLFGGTWSWSTKPQ